MDLVSYTTVDGVATITLNRPDAMNSMTRAFKEELLSAVERARDDSSARAVLITGRGKAFSAGQDLREHAESLAAGSGLDDTVRSHYNPIVLGIARIPKPVVAAVNGVAAGAGAALAFACDFRILSEKASFSLAFANIGLGSDSGASWTLPRLVGHARATELLMLGEPVRAQRAAEIGLATRVVAHDELAESAHAFAHHLASGPTIAYAAIKGELTYGANMELDQALAMEADLQDQCVATSDHHEATTAFLNKEKPTFQGR
ncbi:enoyl-CoA hydratase-related protein [Lipingzhangella sp. LS1_29]|uniref:Enoyl-CoA hydratase-related protein n=1 Tax=Lipingzhangella rawalii TaxID=2055835 RepID=A0ABU2H387_9ACTN|nr:enoyl-CoA hydratase-related protein [Lipingzhangella rawalii]MDS1269766.1 enoyl-CoA hydratase-related protein [Lipingzhangella rawalii]